MASTNRLMPASLGVNSPRPGQGINQQQLAETLALRLFVDRQTAQSHAWDTAWQLLAPSLRQMAALESGQRQGVIAMDASRRVLAGGDEGLRQPLILVLAGNLSQPVVQFLPATVELLPVMAPR